MDREELKRAARARVRPLVLGLDRLGVTPNTVSVLGVLISAAAGWLAARDLLFPGGLVLLVGSLFDMLDGDLARLQGRVSRQGAFLDSNFDRLAEAALFTGLAWHYMEAIYPPDHGAVLLILIALAGSLTTSYARARAEGLGTECSGGWIQRPERIVLLVLGMLLGRHVLKLVLAVLAVVSVMTTLQRIVTTSRRLAAEDAAAPRPEGRDGDA
jgi:CDP-diacylglycerol--glycerol-3-phosphate 3-phosphatidyltransferase